MQPAPMLVLLIQMNLLPMKQEWDLRVKLLQMSLKVKLCLAIAARHPRYASSYEEDFALRNEYWNAAIE